MDGISSKISKGLGGGGTTAGKSAGKLTGSSFVASFKRTLAAAGIGAAISKVVNQGAELQQNLGGTEAVFGEFAKNIQDEAKQAYKNMGASASDYMATANKMASLFQGSGLKQQRATELTTKAMQRAADVASVMGIDTQTAFESITGAAKGNFTMMDNLGVAMNATTLEAYAAAKGINFVFKEASNAQKAELAMQMFFEKTAQYAGNFERESVETISGSLGAMKAAFSNVLGDLALGNDLQPSLDALTQTVIDFGHNLIPTLGNILRGLPPALVSIVATLGPEIASAALGFLTETINVFSNPETLTSLTTTAFTMMQTLILGLAEAAPTLIPQLVGVVVQLAESLTTPEALEGLIMAAVELVLALSQGIIDSVPILIEKAPIIIYNLLEAILRVAPQLLMAGAELLLQVATGIVNSWGKIIEVGGEIVEKVKNGFSDKVAAAKTWGKDLIQNFINGIKEKWQALKDSIANVAQSIKDVIGFSEPEKGPLSNFHTYAPDMMELFTQGVKDNEGMLRNQIKRSFDISSDINAATAANSRVQKMLTAKSYSAPVAVSEIRSNDELISHIDRLGEDMRNMRLYLNGRQLVGGIINDIDRELGYKRIAAQRGGS